MTIMFVCFRSTQLPVSEGAGEDAEALHTHSAA